MKRLAAVAGVGIAMCVGAGVASADYRQPTPTLTINPTTVAAGGSVTATVQANCRDGETIGFSIEPNGDFTTGFCAINRYVGRLTAPSQPGAYEVIAAGLAVDLEVNLTVTAAPGGSEEPLPSTGSDDAVGVALIGGALVAGGAALLGLGRIGHLHRRLPHR